MALFWIIARYIAPSAPVDPAGAGQAFAAFWAFIAPIASLVAALIGAGIGRIYAGVARPEPTSDEAGVAD